MRPNSNPRCLLIRNICRGGKFQNKNQSCAVHSTEWGKLSAANAALILGSASKMDLLTNMSVKMLDFPTSTGKY